MVRPLHTAFTCIVFLFLFYGQGLQGQCVGGASWPGGTPTAGTTTVNGLVQGSVAVSAVTTGLLQAGRPIYSATNNVYLGNSYRSLGVARGASVAFGAVGTSTTFNFAVPVPPGAVHVRVRDIRGDGFNLEAQRVQAFLGATPVAVTFTDLVNGAFITGGNIINGPGTTTNLIQASARGFFAGSVDRIVVTSVARSDFVVIDIFSNCLIVLPFELRQLEAFREGDYNRLNWTVEEASGFSHYEIENSIDARQWKKIGEIGVNETVGPNRYSFLDTKAAATTMFYRLVAREFSGKTTYSEVVYVARTSDPIRQGFRIHPNPFGNQILLSLPGSGALVAELTCSSADGKIIYTGRHKSRTIAIPTHDWPRGLYLLKIQLPGEEPLILRAIRQ